LTSDPRFFWIVIKGGCIVEYIRPIMDDETTDQDHPQGMTKSKLTVSRFSNSKG